jgi:hypothetical protein
LLAYPDEEAPLCAAVAVWDWRSYQAGICPAAPPSLVFYAQRFGMNAIENDMKMIVLGVPVQCKNGKMFAAHSEMPFQNIYGFIALRLRRLLAFLPTQQPMIDGVFTASRLHCKSDHFGALPLLRVRIEVSACANVLRLLCVCASIGFDIVEQAANT